MERIYLFIASFIYFLVAVAGQQVGTLTAEVHPPLTTYLCSASGCQAQTQSITLDANWRWLHKAGQSTNCFSGTWDASNCPDPATCTANCALEGADYPGTYGISASGSSVKMNLVTGSNVGSRAYLMKDDNSYQMFKLKNQEFSFDVDVSQLPCGLNGALYLVEMDEFGGSKKFPNNKAGAKYGTGYCDAQCPKDIKYINGEANLLNWNGATGQYGACCAEMDLWEANSISTVYTPHPCQDAGLHRCVGEECSGNGDRYSAPCDMDGCDFNSYRQGAHTFYGPGMTIDSNKPITVVTRFVTSDNTDSGDLVDIQRVYVQNGKVIPNSFSSWAGLENYDSITDQYCADQKSFFDSPNAFKTRGGLKGMGDALGRGMVLVLSVWTDASSNMLWLDSNAPPTSSAKIPGVARGYCPITGSAAATQSQYPNSAVTYSNIKWGPIGTTSSASVKTPTNAPVQTAAPTPTKSATPTTTTKAPSSPTTTTTTKAPSSPTKAPSSPTTTTTTKAPATPTKAPSSPTTTTTTKTPVPSKPSTPPTTTTTKTPSAPSAPTSSSSCGTISQTSTSGWTQGDTKYSQWTVTITAGTTPIKSPVSVQINTPAGSALSSFWSIALDKSTGGFSLPAYAFNGDGVIPVGGSVSFGYSLSSDVQASITVTCGSAASSSGSSASGSSPSGSGSSPSGSAPSFGASSQQQQQPEQSNSKCTITVTPTVQTSYSSGVANVQYYLSFKNTGSAAADSVQVSIAPQGGSSVGNFYGVASSSGSVYTFPLYTLAPGQTRISGGYVVTGTSSENPPAAVVSITGSTCVSN